MSSHEPRSRVAALFAGQLSERVGMGKDFFEEHPHIREILKRTEDRCGRELIRPMLEGPSEELARDEIAQPALFALGCGVWESLIQAGVSEPAAVAGYSLGNYAALVAAESIGFDDALSVLVRVLDLVREKRVRGGMAAVVGMTEGIVREICDEVNAAGEWVEPANINADNQIVVAGTDPGIDAFVLRAAPRCLKAVRLPMNLPIHSQLMSPISDVLRRELPGKIEIRAPRIPYYAATFGRRISTGAEVLEILVSQVERPSRWSETVRALLDDGHNRFVEIGSGAVLTKMLRWIDRKAEGVAMESPLDMAKLTSTDSFART